MRRFVLDSYALLAWQRQERAGVRVRQLFRNRENHFWMTVVNMGEVYYRTARDTDRLTAEDVLRWMRGQRITFVDVNQQLTIEAARLKARYAISYADSYAAALAVQMQAKIVTGDPEFLALEADGVAAFTWLN